MQEVKDYLSNTGINAPFFLVVGDGNYGSVKIKLSEFGLKPIGVSSCCSTPDKPPSLDRLTGMFDFADIDGGSDDKKTIVFGLGEYLALRGESEAFKWLSKIKDMKIGNARVVLLLRGVSAIVRKLQAADPTRFTSSRVLFVDSTDSNINVALVPIELNLPAKNGIQELLKDLEEGKTSVSVKTNAVFDNSLFLIRKIKSAFDGIKHLRSTFPLAESFGTAEQWTDFLAELTVAGGDVGAVIDKLGSSPESIFQLCISGNSYKNWLCFITMKLKIADIASSYLKYVLETTDNFGDLKRNALNAILHVPHTDKRFEKFYEERKTLVEKFSESDVAAFVSENQRDVVESVYKLTNQTLVERKEFIALFENTDKKTVLSRANAQYQALSDYLREYTFNDSKVNAELNALFTEYFNRYKWQKVLNTIDDDFIEQVEDLASRRVYNGLRTRTEALGTVDKTGTFLYWIDALGVEFLGYIQKLCERKGLSIQIHIVQAELPTITTTNNDFFYNGEFEHREKEERLDELKHKESGGYVYKPGSRPVHLAQELDIIAEVLEKAATRLALHQCKRVLIASDHGASRLAVINEQEEKYEVDAESKGKHGGRCCKRPSDYSPTAYDLPFATESVNGEYLILANYGRFKGSRAANIEVHGGASLEEVVVPIIELTLANPDTEIEILNGDKLFASFRKKLEFILFSKTELSAVSVNIKGKSVPYRAAKTDKSHYHVVTDITRPGEYIADVLDGDNLVGIITIHAQSETQKKSADGNFGDIL